MRRKRRYFKIITRKSNSRDIFPKKTLGLIHWSVHFHFRCSVFVRYFRYCLPFKSTIVPTWQLLPPSYSWESKGPEVMTQPTSHQPCPTPNRFIHWTCLLMVQWMESLICGQQLPLPPDISNLHLPFFIHNVKTRTKLQRPTWEVMHTRSFENNQIQHATWCFIPAGPKILSDTRDLVWCWL